MQKRLATSLIFSLSAGFGILVHTIVPHTHLEHHISILNPWHVEEPCHEHNHHHHEDCLLNNYIVAATGNQNTDKAIVKIVKPRQARNSLIKNLLAVINRQISVAPRVEIFSYIETPPLILQPRYIVGDNYQRGPPALNFI